MNHKLTKIELLLYWNWKTIRTEPKIFEIKMQPPIKIGFLVAHYSKDFRQWSQRRHTGKRKVENFTLDSLLVCKLHSATQWMIWGWQTTNWYRKPGNEVTKGISHIVSEFNNSKSSISKASKSIPYHYAFLQNRREDDNFCFNSYSFKDLC